MSQKITAKNLQYSTNLPPFLARLRGEAQDSASNGPDPILSARRRPTKPRSGSAEAEDAPTIVDEHGNVVQDVTVGLDGTVKEKEGNKPSATDETAKVNDENEDKPAGDAAEKATAAAAAANIGVGKKRKVGKVIGGDAEEEVEEEEKGAVAATAGKSNKKSDDKDNNQEGAAKSKHKKKVKKIKLSFGDEEG